MTALRIREIMDELHSSGMDGSQLVLVTELVATCLITSARPKTDAERAKAYRERHASRDGVTEAESTPLDIKTLPPEITYLPSVSVLKTKMRGERLPEDWNPPESLWLWGKQKLGLTDAVLKFETGAFRDHFWGASGARAVKRKWDSAWKNWMREAVRRGPKGAAPKPSNVLAFAADWEAKDRRQAEAQKNQQPITDDERQANLAKLSRIGLKVDRPCDTEIPNG